MKVFGVEVIWVGVDGDSGGDGQPRGRAAGQRAGGRQRRDRQAVVEADEGDVDRVAGQRGAARDEDVAGPQDVIEGRQDLGRIGIERDRRGGPDGEGRRGRQGECPARRVAGDGEDLRPRLARVAERDRELPPGCSRRW